jgi:hypothetical protein
MGYKGDNCATMGRRNILEQQLRKSIAEGRRYLKMVWDQYRIGLRNKNDLDKMVQQWCEKKQYLPDDIIATMM